MRLDREGKGDIHAVRALADPGDRPLEGVVHPPIVRGQPRDISDVDGLGIAVVKGVIAEEGDRVGEIFRVRLGDLELEHEEIGEWQGAGIGGEPLAKVDGVAHAEAVEHDVDVATVGPVEEEQPLVTVQRVEGAVPVVAKADEEIGDTLPLFGARGEIQVVVASPELGEHGAGAAEGHTNTTEETDEDAVILGRGKKSSRLDEDVGVRAGCIGITSVRQNPSTLKAGSPANPRGSRVVLGDV